MGRPRRRVSDDSLASVIPLFETLLSDLQMELIVLDRDHRIVLANRYACNSTKRSLEEMLGQHCYSVFHDQDEVCTDCPAVSAFRTGKAAQAVLPNPDNEGGARYAEITALPIGDESGAIRYSFEYRRDVSEKVRFERELLDRNRRLAALNAIAQAVNSSLDLDQILQLALDSVLELMGLRPMGGIFLLDEDGQELHLKVHHGLSSQFVRQENTVRVGECLCGLAAKTGELIHSANSKVDWRHDRESQAEAHSHIVVPLKSRDRVQGIMFLYPPLDYRLDLSDSRLMEMIGGQIGAAIENARLYRSTDAQLQKRVAELATTLQNLEAQAEELKAQDEELQAHNEELRCANESLVEADHALAQSQKALLTQLNQFGTIFDSMNAVVYVADMDTYELLFLNSYAAKLFGEDSLGKPCFQRLQKGQTGRCNFCTNDLLARDGVAQAPHVWEFQNTVTGRWFLCIDRAIQWADGRLVRLEIAVDISDRKQAEQARQEYLRAISHDLRNPLSMIQGHAQVLQMALTAPNLKTHVERSAGAIVAASRAMNMMIEDLVDTARLESGQLKLNVKPLDLPALANDLRQRLADINGGDRIDLRVPTSLLVSADPDRVERILMNLVSNAFKYSGHSSRVVMTISEGGREAVIAVSDTGQGIPPDELPHVFEQYFRGRDMRERLEGLGLGLYITKGLVEDARRPDLGGE